MGRFILNNLRNNLMKIVRVSDKGIDPSGMKTAGDVGRELEVKVDRVLSKYFKSVYEGVYEVSYNNPFKSLINHNEDRHDYNSQYFEDSLKDVGIVPDHIIVNKVTGNKLVLESKNQDGWGNAYERMYKFCTPNISRLLRKVLDTDINPVAFVCSGSLCDPRFVRKIEANLGTDYDYLFWDKSEETLIKFFEEQLKPKLEGEG